MYNPSLLNKIDLLFLYPFTNNNKKNGTNNNSKKDTNIKSTNSGIENPTMQVAMTFISTNMDKMNKTLSVNFNGSNVDDDDKDYGGGKNNDTDKYNNNYINANYDIIDDNDANNKYRTKSERVKIIHNFGDANSNNNNSNSFNTSTLKANWISERRRSSVPYFSVQTKTPPKLHAFAYYSISSSGSYDTSRFNISNNGKSHDEVCKNNIDNNDSNYNYNNDNENNGTTNDNDDHNYNHNNNNENHNPTNDNDVGCMSSCYHIKGLRWCRSYDLVNNAATFDNTLNSNLSINCINNDTNCDSTNSSNNKDNNNHKENLSNYHYINNDKCFFEIIISKNPPLYELKNMLHTKLLSKKLK